MGKIVAIDLGPSLPKTIVRHNDITAKTTAATAKQNAHAFAAALKTIGPDKGPNRYSTMWSAASDVWGAAAEPWTESARNQFMLDLGAAFGGLSAFQGATSDNRDILDMIGADDSPSSADPATDLAKIHWANQNKGLPAPYDVFWAPSDGLIVIPISPLWPGEGYSVTYQLQAFQEKSTSNGVENYVDVYVQAEAKFPSIPLVQDILSIDIKAGIKKGSKKYDKQETKDAVRTGQTVSKTYTLQKVGRDSVIICNRPNSTWDYLTVEAGWQIVPKEGGETIGPFWPWYRLDASELPDSAFAAAAGALERALEKAAVEVARLMPLLH